MLAILAAAACSDGQDSREGPTFVIEVLGATSALRRYELHVDGMQVDPDLDRWPLSRALSTRMPWPRLRTRSFELTAHKDEMELGSVTLAPFQCVQDADFEARLRDGWSIVETHQAYLYPDGSLELDTDFDHRLSYGCELSRNGMEDGEGWSQRMHKEPRCEDAERRGSSVEVRGVLDGNEFTAVMQTCYAVLTDEGAGRLKLDLSLQIGGTEFVAGLNYCLQAPAQSYPLTLEASGAADECPYATMLAVDAVGKGNFDYLAPEGQWVVETLDTKKHGRVTGEVELSLVHPPRYDLTIRGRFDLPLLRVPVEGSGLP